MEVYSRTNVQWICKFGNNLSSTVILGCAVCSRTGEYQSIDHRKTRTDPPRRALVLLKCSAGNLFGGDGGFASALPHYLVRDSK